MFHDKRNYEDLSVLLEEKTKDREEDAEISIRQIKTALEISNLKIILLRMR